jgi:hypothetical protein
LPGPIPFQPAAPTRHAQTLNPDGLIETPSVFICVEAKRIKSSSFQAEQLARNFVVVSREAQARRPLLLLILGKEPPVKVAGASRQQIDAAIRSSLTAVLDKVTSSLTYPELLSQIDTSVAWITWREIATTLATALVIFQADFKTSSSVCQAVGRIVNSVTSAIERHT